MGFVIVDGQLVHTSQFIYPRNEPKAEWVAYGMPWYRIDDDSKFTDGRKYLIRYKLPNDDKYTIDVYAYHKNWDTFVRGIDIVGEYGTAPVDRKHITHTALITEPDYDTNS